MYGLRKIYTGDPTHFDWPTTPGTEVVWDTNNQYNSYYDNINAFGQGFIVAKVINGGLDYLNGSTWAVVSYDEADFFPDLYGETVELVSKLTIVYATDTVDDTVKSYFPFNTFDSDGAYQWGMYIGDQDDVIGYITDQSYMGVWVKYIRPSDHDRFISQITEPDSVYFWATELDETAFVPRLEDQYAFSYAIYFPDRIATVRNQIADPFWVYMWNTYIEPENPLDLPSSPDQSLTPTPSITASITPTPSPTITISAEVTPTPSITPTISVTPSPN